jgi:hypothetical protein
MNPRLPAVPSASILAAAVFAALPVSAVPQRPAEALPEPVDRPARPLRECGTVVTPDEAAAYLRLLEERGPVDGRGFSPPYHVPIKAHVIRMSDGSGGLPAGRVDQAIVDANGHYATTGIVFFLLGDIDYIDSDEWYTTSTLDEIDDMRTTNLVPDAINMYFTENLDYEGGGLCGISAFTFSSVQSIAMRNSCTANPAGLGNHSTFSHEIGHYFDLFHTHETAFGDELVDGSNCEDAGDLVCDTPADPVLGTFNVDTSCDYFGGDVDGNGDPYDPDPTQLMSYSLKHCRDNFSSESLDRIVDTLLSGRSNLISPLVAAPSIGEAGAASLADAAGLRLHAPRPNPTAGAVRVAFSLPREASIDVAVYDVRGARVRTLVRGAYAAGEHAVEWDGADARGREASPGTYFVRLSAGGEDAVRKVQVLR